MQVITFLSVILASFIVFSAPQPGQVVGGQDLQVLSLEQAIAQIPSNAIVVIGEQHGFAPLASQQLAILELLRKKHGRLHVGMEFLYYPDQEIVDRYRQGLLLEADFLQAIKWGQPDYKFYKEQILFPRVDMGEITLALNAPRSLTGRVSKVGIAGLNPQELSLMPPDFTLGNAQYLERFTEIMGGHVAAEALARYFQAQSIWDETMAWKAGQIAEQEMLVIVVGEFHVAFGGGLPDRLKARYPGRPVVTFSQVITEGLTADEIIQEVQPSLKYGPRADYILVH